MKFLGVEITDVFADSRQVVPGSLFCCIAGEQSDGHTFAKLAQDAGAAALAVEREIPECDLPQIVLSSTRAWMGGFAAKVYGEPAKKLKMFAVTGTNGKTTSTFVIRNLLEKMGVKCGIIGTMNSERTTPESCEVQRLLANMVRNGCEACVMETSSHGLFLGRLNGCEFDVMLFTNLNPEHLDFHKDMESYFSAKCILFDKYAKPNSKIAANSDDAFGARVLKKYRGAISFGSGGAQVSAHSLKLGLDGSRFELCVNGENLGEFFSPLVAHFNVRNTLGAIAAVWHDGIDVEKLREAVAQTPQVPGRLEKHFVTLERGSACVIIDFAHTPEALRNVLSSVREFCRGKLVSIFGHGGGRYEANRPALGAVAANIADVIIVTMDNPRNELPEKIAEQVIAGARAENPNADIRTVLNRSEAIKTAFCELRDGDVIVLSGKGPEKYLTVGTEKIPFSDAGEVERLIKTGSNLPVPAHLVLDSRDVSDGCGFVALEGEKTDGHLYIEQALAGGAKFIVGKRDKKLALFPAHVPYIALDNTEHDLAKAARRHIERVSPKEIIAITGSVGKTTTREAVKRVLESKYRVHAATRSFNTLIGCAVSVLAMPEDTEILLLEFGANKPGEILELTQFFAPTFSIITEVAPVHLEGFKTIEGVLSGKMEITKSENLRTFLYNADNAYLRNAEKNFPKVISVGHAGDAAYRIIPRSKKFSLPLEWQVAHNDETMSFSSDLWGKHLMLAMSVAAAVGSELGVDKTAVCEAVDNYEPLGGRGRIIRGQKTRKILIDDAYNANPASMGASLSAFLELDAGGEKWAVLGDMRELGAETARFHREILELAKKLDKTLLVGSLWRDIGAESFASWTETAEYLAQNETWRALLVKGSNSHKLQKLVSEIEAKI